MMSEVNAFSSFYEITFYIGMRENSKLIDSFDYGMPEIFYLRQLTRAKNNCSVT